MSGRPLSDLLSEYTLVLRGTGLTEVGIARLHDAPQPDPDETIHEVLQRRVSGTPDESQLFARLGKTIVDSPRGIEAPAEYWNSAPAVHLRELLSPYGLDVSFEPTRYADSIADGQFDIHVTDADGTSYRTRFSYPDSPLGDDNYPALLHQLEEDILSAAGLTFVRLRSPVERWRFMMLTTDQLEALQNRYGERLDVLGEPLLAEHQPAAFAEEEGVPVPEWYDAEPEAEADDTEVDELLEAGAADPTISPEVPTDGDVAAPDLEGVETEEEILQAVEPDSPGERTTGPGDGEPGAVEASDDEVQSVFGDLSDVSLEKATDGGPSASTPGDGGSLALQSSGTAPAADSADADEEPLDELFDELEREVADTGREAGLDGSDDASISELVGGDAPDGPDRNGDTDGGSDGVVPATPDAKNGDGGLDTIADRDEDAVHDSASSTGGPDPDTDTTATELFDRLGREQTDRT